MDDIRDALDDEWPWAECDHNFLWWIPLPLGVFFGHDGDHIVRQFLEWERRQNAT